MVEREGFLVKTNCFEGKPAHRLEELGLLESRENLLLKQIERFADGLGLHIEEHVIPMSDLGEHLVDDSPHLALQAIARDGLLRHFDSSHHRKPTHG